MSILDSFRSGFSQITEFFTPGNDELRFRNPRAGLDQAELEMYLAPPSTAVKTSSDVEPDAAPALVTAPQAGPNGPTWVPQTSNDDILFLALNNSPGHESAVEARMLAKKSSGKIELIKDSKIADTHIANDGTKYKVDTLEGARAFAKTLKLTEQQTEDLAYLLASNGNNITDEIARIAEVWARAERGEVVPSRFILSGHSTGYGVRGDTNGALSWEAVEGLARILPKGAAAVEDLMVAACYTGGKVSMQRYKQIFPRLQTAVGYISSPGTYAGAIPHQIAWEEATRGRTYSLRRETFAGLAKADHVFVWVAGHEENGKWVDEKLYAPERANRPIAEVRKELEAGLATFQAAFEGKIDIPNPQKGPVRAFYNTTHDLLQNSDLDPTEGPGIAILKDKTVRILFYTEVRRNFAKNYSGTIAKGYAALGMTAPDFSKLSRKAALAEIAKFKKAVASSRTTSEASTRLERALSGFAELNPIVIPENWIF